MATFKAIRIDKAEKGQTVGLVDFDEKDLMDGDVTVKVEWSTINYKDGLALTGKAPVVRRFPMIPGIDLAGTVEASSSPAWKPGDQVILDGFGLGPARSAGARGKRRMAGAAAPRHERTRSHGDRDGGLYGDAFRHGARAPRAHGRPRPGRGDRGCRRGRLGRHRRPRQARLPDHRLDGPAPGGGLPAGPRGRRGNRAQRIDRPTPRAGQGTLGRGNRHGRLGDPRQCALHDGLWRRRGCLRACRRDGPADQRGALHPARGVAFGHRFRHVSAKTAPRGLESLGFRPRSRQTGGDDQRSRPGAGA